MCYEQRAVSLKGPNSFYFRALYLLQDYKQDPQQTLQSEHVSLKNSEAFFPFTISLKCFFFFLFCLPSLSTVTVQSPRGLTSKSKSGGCRQQCFMLAFMASLSSWCHKTHCKD